MNRRSFLKATAGVAGTGILGGVIAPSETGETSAKKMNPSSAAADYSVAEHRRRLENIARCRKAIRTCLRQVLVTDYLPAQCCYNLGEYPATKPWSLAAYSLGQRRPGRRFADAAVQARPAKDAVIPALPEP